RPTVLILSLSNNLPIGIMHKQLLSGLEKNAEVRMIKNRTAFFQHLHASPRPQAVIVADAAICEEPRHADLAPKLLEYARSGGRVALGVQFCYFLETDCTVSFFRLWGVPWSLAMHPVEKTFALNPDGIPTPLSSAALLPAFTANVLIVHARPCDDAVYSRVDPCEPGDQDQGLPYDISVGVGAAAWARIGQGFLGYVGDVHGEQAFARLTIEMCGVTIGPGDLGARDIFR
ncbi:uncharacterized protein TRAVEDRAFT_92044, partial [Trametes versicolor FP-101664 SS1]|uniref:uncharacterized protein n=1 Tax=Trametes versicolor (strain FP-101664) TaxID=717944 RepID=UPI00046233E7